MRSTGALKYLPINCCSDVNTLGIRIFGETFLPEERSGELDSLACKGQCHYHFGEEGQMEGRGKYVMTWYEALTVQLQVSDS